MLWVFFRDLETQIVGARCLASLMFVAAAESQRFSNGTLL